MLTYQPGRHRLPGFFMSQAAVSPCSKRYSTGGRCMHSFVYPRSSINLMASFSSPWNLASNVLDFYSVRTNESGVQCRTKENTRGLTSPASASNPASHARGRRDRSKTNRTGSRISSDPTSRSNRRSNSVSSPTAAISTRRKATTTPMPTETGTTTSNPCRRATITTTV